MSAPIASEVATFRTPNSAFRIALDCRTALSPKTGDRTYTLTLLQGLARLNLDPARWQFQLLLDAPDKSGILPPSPCFETVVLTAPNSRLWTLIALPRWARSARPDLVHVQYLAPLFLPCPFVTTIHDVVWRAHPQTFPALHRAIMNLGMPSTARRAAAILTGTAFSRGEIARYLRVPTGKIRLTPYAIEERYQAPVSAQQIQAVREKYCIGAAPYVLSVGVQQPRKNVARLIAAFDKVKAKYPDWPHVLVVAGKPGWGDNSALHTSNSALNFIGYVADDDLPALYAGAACFAYPSLYEGFGLTILEAMACGAPVLTSNRGAMQEVAGGAALLCEPRSVDDLRRGLETILGTESCAQALRAAGKLRATHFSVEKLAAQNTGGLRGVPNAYSDRAVTREIKSMTRFLRG